MEPESERRRTPGLARRRSWREELLPNRVGERSSPQTVSKESLGEEVGIVRLTSAIGM